MPMRTVTMNVEHYTQFLTAFPVGLTCVTLEDPAGQTTTIRGMDADIIRKRSPLLAESLDGRPGGPFTLTLGVPSLKAGGAVLHYLYFGDYNLEDPGSPPFEVTFLLHVHVFHIANYLECSPLATLAMGNLNLHTQLALSYPNAPDDLVQALIFTYTHLSDNTCIINTLLDYCVSAFDTQRLLENADFARLAATHETLAGDMCRLNIQRGFESADIPKLAGPRSHGVPRDIHFEHVFAATTELAESSRQLPADSIDAGDERISDGPAVTTQLPQDSEQSLTALNSLPIRTKEDEVGELDAEHVHPASPTPSEDGYVFCNTPGDSGSDSEWSLV